MVHQPNDTPGTAEPAELNAAIIRIAAGIDEFRNAVVRGDAVDLAAVQSEVAALCAAAVRQGAGKADMLRTGFMALIAALEALHAAIAERHAALKGELGALAARQRAASAYFGPTGGGR